MEIVLQPFEQDRCARQDRTPAFEDATTMFTKPPVSDPIKADETIPTRRSFLTRAAGFSALAFPTFTLITTRKAPPGPKNKLTGLAAELINELMSDEAQHAPITQNLLDDPDNTP